MVAHSQLANLPLDLPFRIVSATIGQGAYACIKKAAPFDAPQPVFAVKFIHKDYAVKHGRLTKRQLDTEISLHQRLGEHVHIVQFYHAGEDTAWRWIAMELAEGGDLFDKIESDVGIGEDIAHVYFLQLLNAVQYMHRNGVGHRDIKPENLLLSAEGNLKIADFGLATLFEHNGQTKLCTTSCGSPPYTAPEVVTCDRPVKQRLQQGYYAPLVDIWSCAVVLFVLLVGNTPWDEPLDRSYEFNQYVQATGRPDDELWQSLPEATISLLRGMMKVDPKQRMSLAEIGQHPWVRRPNPHRNERGFLERPMDVATQMFETLKIDFSKTAVNSQPNDHMLDDAMDVSDGLRNSAQSIISSGTPQIESHFDWELNNSGDQKDVQQGLQIGQRNLDEHLSEEPSCSQFASTPRVPMTRTQFARNFLDILPSHNLTRFFSFWPPTDVNVRLRAALENLQVTFEDSQEALDSPSFTRSTSLKIRCLDGRHCPLHGSIVITQIQGVEGNALEANFHKSKGDPLEWRRLFKKVVILCKDIIFRPDENIGFLSQAS